MNVLIINGSPAGKYSITLQTALYLEKCFPSCRFSYLHPGQRIRSCEKDFVPCAQALEAADLIVFCYPVYTFLVPAQLHRFIELMKEHDVAVSGKFATQLSTSKHFYDTTAHRFIQDNCADLGLRYIRGLSADMEDLTTDKGRREAVDFFRFVRWSMENNVTEPAETFTARAPRTASVPAEQTERKPGEVVVVTDLSRDDGNLRAMIDRFEKRSARTVKLVDLAEFSFAAGCLGCFHCAADGKCVHKDGFDVYLRTNIQSAQAIVYAYAVKDHSMGYRFKLYDDRQFCNGHRTVTMGKPVGYLVDGDLRGEPNLRLLMESRAQVGGNFLAGIACSAEDPDGAVDRMAATLDYAIENAYQPPADFLGVGGMKIFRDLIYQMRGLMKADHRFYKEHGFYKDFPQKHRAKSAAMYLVGGMMTNKKLQKKMGNKMNEGMVMPYQAALKKAVPVEDAAEQPETVPSR